MRAAGPLWEHGLYGCRWDLLEGFELTRDLGYFHFLQIGLSAMYRKGCRNKDGIGETNLEAIELIAGNQEDFS